MTLPIYDPAISQRGRSLVQGIGFDVCWEASDNGVVRCKEVLNRRSDIFEAVEGLNLRDIQCDRVKANIFQLLNDGRRIRHIPVRLPKAFGPDRLYLTAQRVAGGHIVGAFCAIAPQADNALIAQADMLSRVNHARDREESFRLEAETMLKGLRLLLSDNATIEKLKALSQMLASAIKGSSSILIRIGPDGTPRRADGGNLTPGGRSAVVALRLQQYSNISIHSGESSPVREVRQLLQVRDGEIAFISLPLASEALLLICGGARSGIFAQADIGLADRFSLILQQAAALKEEQDKLVQSAKLSVLGQMSASLAHELRQPLNTISMAAQNLALLAENDNPWRDTVAAKVSRILGQVERAEKIIDRVRRFSRKASDNIVKTDLCLLLEGVRILTESMLLSNNTQLIFDVEPGLEVLCDQSQVEQVLANLVRNAADAISGIGSSSATLDGTIKVRGWKDAHEIVLRVEDNGPGFPGHILGKPVDAFFTTKDADKGTGLGLSICNTIAREHAGSLSFGNNPAGGAYVELHLPERRE